MHILLLSSSSTLYCVIKNVALTLELTNFYGLYQYEINFFAPLIYCCKLSFPFGFCLLCHVVLILLNEQCP